MTYRGDKRPSRRAPVDRYTHSEPRQWYCRTCNAHEEGVHAPVGWYLLSRQLSEPQADGFRAHQRLGIYCSVRCLAMQLPRLAEIEANLADAADGGAQ